MMLYRVVKRIMDFVIATVLWILFSPLMLAIALLIKFSDGGEVFVGTPVRCGLGGKEFFMYKFRTMVPNAHDMLVTNGEFVRSHKLENDFRVTRIGRVLRNTDLDELPQLINVVLGQMSLVGPRPYYSSELERHFKLYPSDSRYMEDILKVKPGITGVWQVSGRNSIPFRKRLVMESHFAKNPSILNEVYILLKTPWVVITRKGVEKRGF